MIDASNLLAGELAALLYFHADAGVEFLLDDAPKDRFAEFAEVAAASKANRQVGPQETAERSPRNAPSAKPTAPRAATPTVAIPGEEAVELARRAADTAPDLQSLKAAVERFEGCNLRASARTTVFPTSIGTLPILILGPAPSADDDREGLAFSGAHGELLQRMFSAIDIDIGAATLAHAVPWRPPGGRPPTPAEAEICRPFAMRMIALARPRLIVMLGNFTARFFTGSTDPIHALRGNWFEIGDPPTEAIAMLHPQDLITAPLSKRLAWADLLDLESKFRSLND